MIEALFKKLRCKVTQIGNVIREQKLLLRDEELDPTGYEHFLPHLSKKRSDIRLQNQG